MKYPKQTAANQKQQGFTLIEMLIVVGIIGILLVMIAPKIKTIISGPVSKQIYEFASSASSNWRLINMTCGTSNDTAASTIMTTPTVTNSLALVVAGTGVLAADAGCYANANVQPLRSKVGGTSGAYTVAGYPVTWSGGSTATPAITYALTGVPTTTILQLYNQYSSAAGAATATVLPTAADTTDPMVQFGVNTGVNATLSLITP